jgi:hypothetical protein
MRAAVLLVLCVTLSATLYGAEAAKKGSGDCEGRFLARAARRPCVSAQSWAHAETAR